MKAQPAKPTDIDDIATMIGDLSTMIGERFEQEMQKIADSIHKKSGIKRLCGNGGIGQINKVIRKGKNITWN